MKRIIRSVLINAIALWLVSVYIPGISIESGIVTLMLAALVLGVVTLLIKPFVSLLFLPINLITFGLLSWSVNVIILYVFTKIFPSFTISAWRFEGWSSQGFVIPEMTVTVLWTVVLASIFISATTSFFHWLCS